MKSLDKLIISPNSKVVKFYDVIHFICIIFSIFYIPVEWAVGLNFFKLYGHVWSTIVSVNLAVFIMSILINFNMGFYEKGLKIVNR
jgi:hypothetical protein